MICHFSYHMPYQPSTLISPGSFGPWANMDVSDWYMEYEKCHIIIYDYYRQCVLGTVYAEIQCQTAYRFQFGKDVMISTLFNISFHYINSHVFIFEWCFDSRWMRAKPRPISILVLAISKNRQHNGQKKKGNQQTTIFKHYTYYTRSSSTNPTKIGGEIKCSGRISNSCSTCGTRRVTLVTNPVISHEWGKNRYK
jgi:hypothetical protein